MYTIMSYNSGIYTGFDRAAGTPAPSRRVHTTPT